MRKNIVVIFLLFILKGLLLGENNSALHKQVVGSFSGDLKKITDGVKGRGNYAFIKTPKNKFFIIVLGRASYINKINIYWIKGYEPLKYKVEYSKSLFDWEKAGIFKVGKNEHNGIIVDSVKTKNITAFFIKITILESKNREVRVSEVELLKAANIKFSIKNVRIESVKEHSATVSFDTTIPTSGYVRVGESKGGMNVNAGVEMDLLKHHKISIPKLLKGTRYYFQPMAIDANGKVVAGKIFSFKTKGIPLPRFTDFSLSAEMYACKIMLKMNVKCSYKVSVGKSKESLKEIFNKDVLSDKLKFKILNLVPDTLFYVKITAVDKFKNTKEKLLEFRTKEHNIALNKRVFGTFMFSYRDKYTFNFANLKKVTDGHMGVNGIAVSDDVSKNPQKIMVDLGKLYNLSKIKIIWRSIAYPEKFIVSAGAAVKSVKILKKFEDVQKQSDKILSNGESGLILRQTTVLCNKITARYIFVEVPKLTKVKSDLPFKPGNKLALAEIKVFKYEKHDKINYLVKEIN